MSEKFSDGSLLKMFAENPKLMEEIGAYVQKASVTAGTYTFSPASRSIFVAENLDPVIKTIVPTATPIRNLIARSQGSGQASAWKKLTSFLDPSATGTGTSAFFADAGTPNETTMTHTTVTAAYKLLGRKLSVGLLHMAASQSNPSGTVEDNLLRTKTLEVMLGEEWGIINADSAVDGNAFDGLLKQITTNSGTAGLLTASGVAGYDQTIFDKGGNATHLFVSPREKRALMDELQGQGSIQRIVIGNQGAAVANSSVKSIISPVTGNEIDIVVSRYMGTWAILSSMSSPSGEAWVDMQDLIPLIKLDVPVTTFAKDSFIVEATVLRLIAEPYQYKIGGLA
jgi:uncharacterized membrane protein YeaQ/YmgE (transglycosylase-associated protein family)